VAGELDQGAVVDDVAHLGVFAHEHGAHAVVEDLGRRPAQRLERCGVAAQQGLHVLLRHEPAPQPAAVAKHEREQPDHPLDTGLIGEHGAEMREIDLRLPARRRLEPHLEARRRARPHLAQEILHHGVAAAVAELADLAMQPAAGQVGVGCHALAQVELERADLGRAGLARSIGRRLQAALDVFAHRLAVEAAPPRDGRHAQPLPVQIQDHDEFPKPDHHRIPPEQPRGMVAYCRAAPHSAGLTGEPPPRQTGEFATARSEENAGGTDTSRRRIVLGAWLSARLAR